MNRTEATDKVLALLALFLDVEEPIAPDDDLVDDLGADSLDKYEIVIGLEEEFDIEISDADAESLRTAGEVTTYICRRLGL